MSKWLAPSLVVLAGSVVFAAVQLTMTQAVTSENVTPSPTETAPTVVESPLPVEEPTQEPVTEPSIPVDLPKAATVLEAVVVGLETYCSSANSTVTNKNNWNLWDSNSANYLGYWEVSANSTSGLVVLQVYPENNAVSIHPYTPLPDEAVADASQAFVEWGCPPILYVAKG